MDDTSMVPRYCGNCGEISYQLSSPTCPECTAEWLYTLPSNRIPPYALLLTELAELRAQNRITRQTYAAIRKIYEAKLTEIRPPRRTTLVLPPIVAATPEPPAPEPAVEPVLARPAAAIPAAPARPAAVFEARVEPRPAEPVQPRQAPPAHPPSDIINPVKEWAVRRQADLLLYLGAFMLSISALIFVDHQGSVISGLTKSAILGGYTVAFLAFGSLLRRWERVQEAGPVFVGLGALLTPLNFLNLYASVLRDDGVPQEWVWLIGSGSTAALYALLALKDFGRLYFVPATAAAGVAWASLGATFGLEPEWFGPWFMIVAGSLLLVGWRQYPEKFAWFEWSAGVVAVPALIWTHAFTAIDSENTAARVALPVAWAIVLGVLAATGFALRRQHLLAIVPIAAAMTVGSALWAADILAWEWVGFLVAVCGVSYLAIGHIEPSMRTFSRSAALVGALAGLAAAHASTPYEGSNPWQLPLTYGLLLAAAIGDARWWRPSGLFAPLLVAAGATSTLWAAGVAVEWWGYPWALTGLVLAATATYWLREVEYRNWGWPLAMGFTMLAALSTAGQFEHPWHGAATLALTAGSFFIAAIRSAGSFATLFGKTSERAARIEQQVLARLGGWSVLGAAGFVAYGAGLNGVEGGWLFAGIGLMAWAAVAVFRGRVANIEEVLAPIGLTSILAGALAGLPDQLHAAMVLGLAAPAAALAGPRSGPWAYGWQAAALGMGFGGLAFAHGYETPLPRETWQIPAVYGLVLAGFVIDAVYRRYEYSILAVPAVACAAVASLAWYFDWNQMHQAWAPLAVAGVMAAATYRVSRESRIGRVLPAYASALAAAPLLFLGSYFDAPAAGFVAFAATAGVLGTLGVRRAKPLSWLFGAPDTNSIEPQLWVVAGYASLLAALGFLADATGLSPANGAWLLALAAVAVLAAPAIRPRVTGERLATALACGLPGLVIALMASLTRDWQSAVFLAAGAGALIANARQLKEHWLYNVAAVMLFAALGALWSEAGLPGWAYALVVAGIGVVTYAALFRIRASDHELRSIADFLTVGIPVLAILAAAGALAARSADFAGGDSMLASPEWLALALTFGTAAMLVVTEGVLRAGRSYIYAGAAGLLGAVEMAIASFEPTNVQAFTVPVAVYLMVLGFVMRHTTPLFGRHMLVNEGLFVLATLVFVLPPAQQSFAPGGESWGLLVLGEAIAILMLGLAFGQRWLTVSGVVTLAAAGGRYAFASGAGDIPNWVVIGLVGLLLLGLGTLLLFERDWWDRTRARLAGWWLEDLPHDPPMPPPPTGQPVA